MELLTYLIQIYKQWAATKDLIHFLFAHSIRIKDTNYGDGEDDLKHFLKRENDLMANRLKSGERTFDPYTKDTRLVDEKYAKFNLVLNLFIFYTDNNCKLLYLFRRKQNEAARTTLKSLVGKLSEKLGKKLPASMTGNADADAKSKSNTNYVDPMLAQLKQTDVIIFVCNTLFCTQDDFKN